MWSAWWIEVPLSEKIHKDYNVTSNHTDIALLELEKSVYQFFNSSLLPAYLHHGIELITRNLTVTTWQLYATREGNI